MAMLADLLKEIIANPRSALEMWDNKLDFKGVLPPTADGEDATIKEVRPRDMQRNKEIDADPNNVYDGHGQIVDHKNPFQSLINRGAGEKGTLLGFLYSILGDKPMERQKVPLGQGKIGPDGSGETPGTGQDPALNPTPMKSQKMRQFKRKGELPPVDPNNSDLDAPPDYSQPTALDPQQIEELRKSLLTQAGQMDPNNPNGLAGRMTGPYSKVDQAAQMDEAADIASGVRGGYNSVTSRSPLDPPPEPAKPANFQDALKSMLFGGR